jgi:hypothetical protein
MFLQNIFFFFCPPPKNCGVRGGQLFMHWFFQNGKATNLQQAHKESDEWSPELKQKLMTTDVQK